MFRRTQVAPAGETQPKETGKEAKICFRDPDWPLRCSGSVTWNTELSEASQHRETQPAGASCQRLSPLPHGVRARGTDQETEQTAEDHHLLQRATAV